jgi:hypothetical protein
MVMNKLKLLYQWCKVHDKLAHFTIIGLIATSYLLIGLYNIIPVTIIAVGKELYDDLKTERTGFDVDDLNVDYLAWFVVTIICYLITP